MAKVDVVQFSIFPLVVLPSHHMRKENSLSLKAVFSACLRPVQCAQESAVSDHAEEGLSWPLTSSAHTVSFSDSGGANQSLGARRWAIFSFLLPFTSAVLRFQR